VTALCTGPSKDCCRFRQDLSELYTLHHCFDSRAAEDKNDSQAIEVFLLLYARMNTAVIIYSQHLSRCFSTECPPIYLNVFVCTNHFTSDCFVKEGQYKAVTVSELSCCGCSGSALNVPDTLWSRTLLSRPQKQIIPFSWRRRKSGGSETGVQPHPVHLLHQPVDSFMTRAVTHQCISVMLHAYAIYVFSSWIRIKEFQLRKSDCI